LGKTKANDDDKRCPKGAESKAFDASISFILYIVIVIVIQRTAETGLAQILERLVPSTTPHEGNGFCHHIFLQ
jgi:hypothetical protein